MKAWQIKDQIFWRILGFLLVWSADKQPIELQKIAATLKTGLIQYSEAE